MISVFPRWRPIVQVQPTNQAAVDAAAWLAHLVNTERQRHRLPILQLPEDLAAAARVRLPEVRQNFSHDRPAGTLPDLLRDAGVRYAVVGENIAFLTAWRPVEAAARAHESLMLSPGHRRNILLPRFREIGLGAHHQDGRWYFVQLFAG